jgi:serine/threonine protein kinase
VEWLMGVGCNIREFMENVQIFTGKNSVSESIIITGMIQPTASDKLHRGPKNSNVVIKLTFDPINPLNNSLDVERAIYQNIITKLTNDHNTPNVMSYLGTITCTTKFEDIFSKNEIDLMRPALQNIQDGETYKTDSPRVPKHFLILERSQGIELSKWFDKTRTENDLLAIIFQVVYTLVCFANIKLIHNDLHFGNIFIEDMGRPVTLYFVRGPNSWVKLTTRYIAKIYDFDRGSIDHPAVPRNLDLDQYYCKQYGTCNGFHPKFDFFQFVSTLHQDYLGSVNSTIKDSIKDNWIFKILDWDTWYLNVIVDTNTTRYTAGEVTQSGNIVTGVGTAFISKMVGGTFITLGARLRFTIVSVDSATQLTVSGDRTVSTNTQYYIDYIKRDSSTRLQYNEFPTDFELKPSDQALAILLSGKWTNPPFVTETGDTSILPKEITFTPPEPKVAKIINWVPISTETHPSLSIILGEMYDDNSFNAVSEKIRDLWRDEVLRDFKIDLVAEEIKFASEIGKKRRNLTEDEMEWYFDVLSWLILPMFYRITKAQRDVLLTVNGQVKLIAVMDDIWNMFNNKLPITVPMIQYS